MRDPNNETQIWDYPEETEVREPDEFENDDAEYEENLSHGFSVAGALEG